MSFSIRTAVQDDIPDLAHLHILGKKAAEKHIVPDGFLNSLTQDDYEEKWAGWLENGSKTLLLETENIHGFVSYGDMRTPPPGTSKIRPLYVSEIYAIYVDPDYFDQGYGHELFKAVCQDLIDHKKNAMCLWALEKNKRARNFYERQGGQRIGKQNIETGGVQAREICYGWRDLRKAGVV